MITPLIRRQLRILAVLGIAATVLVALVYAELPRRVGIGQYDIAADFSDVSGLYPRANVTFQGTKVGKVRELDVRADRVLVVMDIDGGAKIPQDVRATIHSTSAIGEQYVGLTSETGEPPYLSEGDVVARAATAGMLQITPVLENLNALLASVPSRATERVLEQVDEGLGASEDDLDLLVKETSDLVGTAQESVTQTSELIRSLEPITGTQLEVARSTRAYSRYLAAFTRATDGARGDVSSLIENGPGSIRQIGRVVDELAPTLPILLANLTTNAEVLNVYLPNLEQTFVVYPPLISRLQSTALPREEKRQVQLDIKANVNDPASCTEGYRPVRERRDPSDTSPRTVQGPVYCQAPTTAERGVRGARNLPCPDDAGRRAATPAGCGLIFRGAVAAGTTQLKSDAEGGFVAPDGTTYRTGATGRGGERGWSELLLAPLGL